MVIITKEISSNRELKALLKFPSKLYASNNFCIPLTYDNELETLFVNIKSAKEPDDIIKDILFWNLNDKV